MPMEVIGANCDGSILVRAIFSTSVVYLVDLGSRTDGTEPQCRRGMEVSNRTTDARGFRDYIRLFRAVEHEGGRTDDRSRDTHNMERERDV